ncbi:2OG-Fe(II) oxygenase [Thalassotalea litorea]|nr:2OG-Fe(II) oxygenase family protein [Thalassotalea litorea]
MSTQIKINPDLDWDALKLEYQTTSRLQIQNFFTNDTAEYLLQLLQAHQEWYLAYNHGNQFYESTLEDLQRLSPEQRHQFKSNIEKRAQNHFQYVFFQYYISQAIELGENPNHPLHAFEDFVNSDVYLDKMRFLTAEEKINKADSYASYYAPGHFLSEHDDIHPKHDRVAACTFSLTKNWQLNWGGHLAFYDKQGNIDKALIPAFNTMNVFKIPQSHAVQPVAPWAGAKRLSLLSWLHR